jgi:hypothetical protein
MYRSHAPAWERYSWTLQRPVAKTKSHPMTINTVQKMWFIRFRCGEAA